ncbi:Alpha/beta hydrolase family protein [compost metagenome]
MRKTVTAAVLLALAVYLGLCVALYAFQRSLVYFPQPRAVGGTENLMALPTADASVLVTVRPHAGSKALIYFGGNAEDVSQNLPSFAEAFPEHAIYLLHYRGYGGSGGKPSEEAIQRDALTLFDLVHASHPQIAVVGRSLGSGVAIRLASQRPAARLVLITPYNSIEELGQKQFPIFPIRWLLQDKYRSWRYAQHIAVPTLVLIAEHDEVIPRWSSMKLYRQFKPGVAKLEVIAGRGHNDISASADYLTLLGQALP